MCTFSCFLLVLFAHLLRPSTNIGGVGHEGENEDPGMSEKHNLRSVNSTFLHSAQDSQSTQSEGTNYINTEIHTRGLITSFYGK